jgi:hypothetical protein
MALQLPAAVNDCLDVTSTGAALIKDAVIAEEDFSQVSMPNSGTTWSDRGKRRNRSDDS